MNVGINRFSTSTGSFGIPRVLTPGAILLFVIVVPISGCGSQKRTLSAHEVRALISGKTVKGHHDKKNYSFVRYYEPSGTFRSYQNGSKTPRRGKWSVNRNGDICIRWDGELQDLCRKIITDDKGRYWKVLIKPNGKQITIITFHSFVDGNEIDKNVNPNAKSAEP